MPVSKVISATDAIAIIHDGDVVATSGYGGHGVAEELLIALEQRFLSEGDPRDLTLVHAGGQGDVGKRGLNHLGHEGMIKRVIGGHYGLMPRIAKLAIDEKIEAYNFPEGVIVHLYRNIAAGAPGLLSTIGLGTFVDPRVEGGKVNTSAKEDLVRVVEFGGEESLLYRAFPIDIAIVRGTTADPDGNVTMEHEALSLEALSLAIAAKTSGGYVLCQVERIAQAGSLDSREVRIPGVLVDAIVVAEPGNHMQTFATAYHPGMSGEIRVPLETLDRLPLDHRKVIARRAALELAPDSVVNLGVGLPDAIGRIAAEENIQDLITLTMDPGVFGGIPLSGLDFGGAINREAVIDHASAFDFIDGGGLDSVFLGVGQVDASGDVNVSRFDGRLAGCGGFINLTQRTPKVVFVTTFTSGGLRTTIEDGRLHIVDEGRIRKFVDEVEQITFCADRSRLVGQEVMYVTERAVFRLGRRGIVLSEVAPGIDIERDVLALLPFEPTVDGPGPMDVSLLHPGSLDLRDRILDVRIEDRLTYDEETNTVFMNYAGMHVRTPDDVDRIVQAVDALLGPLERRVNSIVNYDRFVLDEEAVDAYADAVRYVDESYYLSVSRHSTSGFLRLKLGKELTKRRIAPALYETAEEAKRHLDE